MLTDRFVLGKDSRVGNVLMRARGSIASTEREMDPADLEVISEAHDNNDCVADP